jgi:hypothetical protein
MSPLTESTRLTLAKTPGTGLDADAQAYIAAVEAADGATLEAGVKWNIDQFVRGCKADGIWTAIKACCILSGARTLAGALVPLVGTAPTNFNFTSGDYNRRTGLVGNGSTKWIDSNRLNNADPLNSQHLSVSISSQSNTTGGGNQIFIGTNYDVSGATVISRSGSTARGGYIASRNSSGIAVDDSIARTGFHGLSRSNSSQIVYQRLSGNTTYSQASQATSSETIGVFRGGSSSVYSDARLAFYSIGESLDLALLDARVTTLVNSNALVIP